jgi:DNA-binding IclR family transcriptional regulator
MIVIKRWEPKLRLSINVPVATRRGLEITGSGIVMLCSMAPAELDSSLALINARYSSFKLRDLEPYRKRLKANGVLRFDSKLMDGVIDLSVPLTSKDGQLHGALTVPYANNTTCDANIEDISSALLQIAHKISNMLIRS